MILTMVSACDSQGVLNDSVGRKHPQRTLDSSINRPPTVTCKKLGKTWKNLEKLGQTWKNLEGNTLSRHWIVQSTDCQQSLAKQERINRVL